MPSNLRSNSTSSFENDAIYGKDHDWSVLNDVVDESELLEKIKPQDWWNIPDCVKDAIEMMASHLSVSERKVNRLEGKRDKMAQKIEK